MTDLAHADPLAELVTHAENDLNDALARRDTATAARRRLQDTEHALQRALEDLRLYRNLLALAPFCPSHRLLHQRIPGQRRPTR